MADLAATNARGNTKLEDEDEDEDEEGLAAAAPAVVVVVVVVEEAEGSVGVMVVAERATRGVNLEAKTLTFNLMHVPMLRAKWWRVWQKEG